MIYNIVILSENLLNGWCWMRMRPARLMSNAFLYTTNLVSAKNGFHFLFMKLVKLLMKFFSSFGEHPQRHVYFKSNVLSDVKKLIVKITIKLKNQQVPVYQKLCRKLTSAKRRNPHLSKKPRHLQ